MGTIVWSAKRKALQRIRCQFTLKSKCKDKKLVNEILKGFRLKTNFFNRDMMT